MSVIVGIKYNGGIVVAADKQVTSGNIKYDNVTKIIKTKYSNCCIGTVGCLRDANIMCSLDEIISYKDIILKTDIDFKFVNNNLVPNLFDILRGAKRLKINDGIEESLSEFIYCTSERMFNIYCDGSVVEMDKYIVVGCGEDSIRGYLNSIKLDNLTKEDAIKIVKKSIKECCKDDIYINDNVDIILLEGGTKYE